MKTEDSVSETKAVEAIDWQVFLVGVLRDFDCVTGTLQRFDKTDQQLKLVAQTGIRGGVMPVVLSSLINSHELSLDYMVF